MEIAITVIFWSLHCKSAFDRRQVELDSGAGEKSGYKALPLLQPGIKPRTQIQKVPGIFPLDTVHFLVNNDERRFGGCLCLRLQILYGVRQMNLVLVRLEVLTAVKKSMLFFQVLTPCRLVGRYLQRNVLYPSSASTQNNTDNHHDDGDGKIL
jgi:hypothetical protein